MRNQPLKSTPGRALPAALLAALIILLGTLFFFRGLGSFYYAGFVQGNVGHFHDNAACMANGHAPYSTGFIECVAAKRKIPAAETAFEYPPAAGALFWLMGLISKQSFQTFQMVFMASNFAMMILCFMIAWNAAAADCARGAPDRRVRVFAAAAVVLLSAGPVALVSYDLLPALLTLGALLLALDGRAAGAGALLGISVALKGYPVALLPLFAAIALRRGNWAMLFRGAAGFAAPLSLFAGAAFAISPKGFLDSFAYHGGRGLELNSVYAALLVLLKHAGVADAVKHFDHGSWNLTGGGLTAALESASSPLLAAALLLGTWRAWVLFSRAPRVPAVEREAALRWAAAVLCLFIVFFKIGSPQFLCWAAPFMILLSLRRGAWLWIGLFAAAGHAATAVFPHLWDGYAGGLRAAPAALLLFSKWCLLVLSVSLLASPLEYRRSHDGET